MQRARRSNARRGRDACARQRISSTPARRRAARTPGPQRLVSPEPRALVERGRGGVITFFTIPKPYEGHIATIQRNALASWTRVEPDAQVLVLGDDPGVAEAAAAIDAEYIPDLPRNEYGTPLLDGAFRIAAERRRNDLLCFVNADILFPPSLADAARRAAQLDRPFVIVGECWNARVEAPLDPDAIDWPALLEGARTARRRRDRLLRLHTRRLRRHPSVRGRPAGLRQLARLEGSAKREPQSSTQRGRSRRSTRITRTRTSAASRRRGRAPEAAENRRLAGGRPRAPVLALRRDAPADFARTRAEPTRATPTAAKRCAARGRSSVRDRAAQAVIRVGYIAGEPNPYRAPHLDRIAEHPDIDLTVDLRRRRPCSAASGQLEYAHEPTILRGPSLPLTRVLHHDYPLTPQIWGLLERERFDVLVVGGWSLMAPQLAIVWARIRHRVPYLIISENHSREPRPAWVRAVKSLVLREVIPQASGLLVTGTLAREHALQYGARPDRITVFPNTSTWPRIATQPSAFALDRDEIRATTRHRRTTRSSSPRSAGCFPQKASRRDARGGRARARVLDASACTFSSSATASCVRRSSGGRPNSRST